MRILYETCCRTKLVLNPTASHRCNCRVTPSQVRSCSTGKAHRPSACCSRHTGYLPSWSRVYLAGLWRATGLKGQAPVEVSVFPQVTANRLERICTFYEIRYDTVVRSFACSAVICCGIFVSFEFLAMYVVPCRAVAPRGFLVFETFSMPG
jgi:hypothetical protein